MTSYKIEYKRLISSRNIKISIKQRIRKLKLKLLLINMGKHSRKDKERKAKERKAKERESDDNDE